MCRYINGRGVHTFLKTLFEINNWNLAVERRFQTFYNEQSSPSSSFEADALLKKVPLVEYLSDTRNMDVLRRFWGIGQSSETLKQIGIDYKISPERVRQIKEKATRILKHPSRKDVIRNNLEKMGFFF
jgi:DNA-directed RNA polymerase sigma subunit (sigma70/sigma32)